MSKWFIKIYLPTDSMFVGEKSTLVPNEDDAYVWEHPKSMDTIDGKICSSVTHSVYTHAFEGLTAESSVRPVELLFFDEDDKDAHEPFGSLRVTSGYTIERVLKTPGDSRGVFLEAFGKELRDSLMSYGLRSIIGKVASSIEEPVLGIGTKGAEDSGDLDALISEITKSTKADISKPSETLDDYICTPELKTELVEIADIFKNEKEYCALGVTLPRGVLLKGAPGTGKTYAARCIAGTTDAIFMSCTASALQGQYIGSGAENIRQVFKGAKALRERSGKPIILFLDELDSFGTRERRGSSGDEENRTLNQLLAEMSGFTDANGILILGATNYPDRLDPAAMRSGRFSRQITVEMPEEDARRNLLEYYFSKIKMPRTEGAEDVATLAGITKGFTPADIAELANETALLALRKKDRELKLSTVNEAIDRIITKETRMVSKPADWTVSVHEAGHVLAEYLYQDSISLKVTNYSYGSTGGFTQSNTENQFLMPRSMYYATIRTLLAGRAAEQVLCKDISVGASNDLQRAKSMAEDAICVYAFEHRTADDMELQVQALLDDEYAQVVNDFEKPENIAILKKISEKLMKDRVLYTVQLVSECGLFPKEF